MKRAFALFLAVVLAFSLLPVSALADGEAAESTPKAETEIAEAETASEEFSEDPTSPSSDEPTPTPTAEPAAESTPEPTEESEPTAAPTPTSGTCGECLTWFLSENGELTVTGTGAMDDYSTDAPAPWDGLREQIVAVVIESGVTTIGKFAFSGCENLMCLTIPESVTSVGEAAFSGCTLLSAVYYDGNAAAWGNVTVGENNDPLLNAPMSFAKPDEESAEGETSMPRQTSWRQAQSPPAAPAESI